MNEETQSPVVPNPTLGQQNVPQNKVWFFVVAVVVIILITAGYFFYTDRSSKENTEIPTNTTQEKTSVPDDQIFLSGFADTGREWPPKEASYSQELKDNPLTKLR